MKRCILAFIGCLFLGPPVCTLSSPANLLSEDQREQMVREEKHFVESLALVYSPALWISYRNGLYFALKNEAQAHQIETLKAARADYVALTNRSARHDLAARVIAESGIDEAWQRKILLPYSETNQNLTPTLNKPLQILAGYKLIRSFEDGDALLEVQEGVCLVMNFSQGTNAPSVSEVWLIKRGREGLRYRARRIPEGRCFHECRVEQRSEGDLEPCRRRLPEKECRSRQRNRWFRRRTGIRKFAAARHGQQSFSAIPGRKSLYGRQRDQKR